MSGRKYGQTVRKQAGVLVDDWWATVFGVSADALWRSVTVRPHGDRLGHYSGIFAAWREGGVHVSLPTSCPGDTVDELTSTAPILLQQEEFWRAFAAARSLRLIGPATHAYLDGDPGPDPQVRLVPAEAIAVLQPQVSADEWEESGFAEDTLVNFGWYDEGVLLAAANLREFADAPRDIGVLVAPSARGRRLVDRVGRAAASYSVEHHQVARWSARTGNSASLRAAQRLGFEPWCTQLAIR